MWSVGKISAIRILFQRSDRNEKGFSLLELIVVLIFVSLMAGLVAPRLAGSLTRMNLRSASQKICSSLRYARSQATSEKMTYTVIFDFEKNGCFIQIKNEDQKETEDLSPDGQKLTDEDEIKSYFLPDGVKVEKAVLGDEEIESETFQIEFFPAGNSSGGDVFLVDEKENCYRIRIDFLTGMVKLLDEEPSDSYL